MAAFVLDEFELGERAARAIENEELGYGPLFDAQTAAYFQAEAAMAVLYENWWGQPT